VGRNRWLDGPRAVVSTSRSGLVAFGASLVGGVWLSAAGSRVGQRFSASSPAWRCRHRGRLANVQPLLSRVEETLAVGAGGRPLIWQETLRVIRDPIMGTGLGSYQTACSCISRPTGVLHQSGPSQYCIAAEGGVLLAVPAILAVVAFIRLFRCGWRIVISLAAYWRRNRSPRRGRAGFWKLDCAFRPTVCSSGIAAAVTSPAR
jgi:hypothetical protein